MAMKTYIQKPVNCLKQLTAVMLLASAIFFPERVHAQIDIEKLMVRENIHCQDIAISATKLIPALHQDNKIDTLYALLYYWDLNCGLAEPLLRFYLLDQIEYNRFDDTFYPDQILTFLKYFRKSTSFENPNFYLDYYAWAGLRRHTGFQHQKAGRGRTFQNDFKCKFQPRTRVSLPGGPEQLSGPELSLQFPEFQHPPK